MPPKKRDAGAAADAAAAAAARPPGSGAEPDAARELMETELLLSFLRSKLGRYQQLGERLQVENFKLSDELEASKLNLRDINEFLTNELKARTAAAAALDERVALLTQRLEEQRQEREAEAARAAADGARELAAMADRLGELQQRCAASAEFQGRRDAQESELGALRERLTRQAKDCEAKVGALERQHLADKERWRREVSARIKETKMQMAQLADQHLESTTKRAILENEAMASELAYHSTQSARLMAANLQLRGDAADLRRQASIAQRTVESVARKNAALQRIIKAILAKLREDGGESAALAAAVAASGGGGGGGGGGGFGPPSAALGLGAVEDEPGEQPEDGGELAAAPAEAEGQRAPAQPDISRAGSGGAAAAEGLVGALAERVAALGDELEAARQALAAAAGLVVAAPASNEGSGGGAAARSARSQPRRPRARQGAAAASAGERGGSVSAALEDGVAAFVLFAVQQLRRAPPPPPHTELDWGAAADEGGRAPASEQLARALLDLLHSYSREQVAAFRGLRAPAPPHADAPGLGSGGAGGEAAEGGDGAPGSPAAAAASGAHARGAAAGVAAPAPAPAPAYAGPHRTTLDPGRAPIAPLPGIEELLTAAASEARASSEGRAGPGRRSLQPHALQAALPRLNGVGRRA
ncbi:hypothetical protein Rsub_10210 [Raphidocelis subcapitata]|uniref:Cilia- and flagella-associated protein 157 n=1 Tax=Raphidocelis subcapitata TaxID=307507 RepID=A0A2V0PL91_9CHLO|nr:hypothetical protein Rsub_10210 [Raphidocelis subcapitata]|eukprot:GBF97785.1 hypothetical protein Rsub_10210 [Raphidocelis subcapitata]